MNRQCFLLLLIGLAAAIAGGCAMIPEYVRPASPVPDAWPASGFSAPPSGP